MNEINHRAQSPCVRNCCLNEEDVCLGCFRRLDEITRWSETGDAERRLILRMAEDRKVAHAVKMSKR